MYKSAIYDFLTNDPEPRHGGVLGCETIEAYHRRRIRRLKLQRLIIRSFPEEFQRLDEYILNEGLRTNTEGKDGIVSACIATFTGRDRLAGAMATRPGQPMHQRAYTEAKALTWVREGRWAELGDEPKPVC